MAFSYFHCLVPLTCRRKMTIKKGKPKGTNGGINLKIAKSGGKRAKLS